MDKLHNHPVNQQIYYNPILIVSKRLICLKNKTSEKMFRMSCDFGMGIATFDLPTRLLPGVKHSLLPDLIVDDVASGSWDLPPSQPIKPPGDCPALVVWRS